MVGVSSNNGTYKLCSSFLPQREQTSPSLSYRRPSSLFLVQKLSFLLLSNQRSFNLSTGLPSAVDLKEQLLINSYITLPSIFNLVTQFLISLSIALPSIYLQEKQFPSPSSLSIALPFLENMLKRILKAALAASLASHVQAALLGSSFGVPGNDVTYDYVIVGGGQAGLAVAARLVEQNAGTVGIIEAGSFYEISNGNLSQVPNSDGASNGKSLNDYQPLIDWGYATTPQRVSVEARENSVKER